MLKDLLPAKDKIAKIIETMPEDERKRAFSVLAKLKVDMSTCKSELSGTQVVGFIFNNKIQNAQTHKEIFVKVVGIISSMFPDDIDRFFTIKGTKKTYFSYDFKDFTISYDSILLRNGKKLYIDTNDNAPQLNRRCQRVLQCFGFPPDELVIFTR